MTMQVCMGATLQCSFGMAPSVLVVTPDNMVLGQTPHANVMDHIPMKNIMPFGMCTTQANPAVAAATSAATAAALGVFTPTPAPCIPATAAPWVPGSPTVFIGNMPALNDTSTLLCTYGGTITVKNAGQVTVLIP